MVLLSEKKNIALEVDRLTNQLKRIKLEQEIVKQKLQLAKFYLQDTDLITEAVDFKECVGSRVQRDTYNSVVHKSSKPTTSTVISRAMCELAYNITTLPEVGDIVRIINPKPGQECRGVIEGFCSDGKAKIRSNQGVLLTRLPKNIRYIVHKHW